MNNEKKFLDYIARLDPVEFIGLSQILCVAAIDENGEPKEFLDLLLQIIDKFHSLKPKKQKEILKVLRDATAKH